jgi:hypothetical protein
MTYLKWLYNLKWFKTEQKKACIIIANSYNLMFTILLSKYGIHLPSPKCHTYTLEISNIGLCVGYKLSKIDYVSFKELFDFCNKQYPPIKYELDIIFILSDDKPISLGLCEYLDGANIYFYDSFGIEMSREDVKHKFNITASVEN